jgi:hypothetical protein
MATLDGIELLETSGAPTSGAAFLLNSPAKVSRRVEVEIRRVKEAPKVPTLDDVYEILGRRHASGEHDLAGRHNEHQP